MNFDSQMRSGAQVALDPPTFSPPVEMRMLYLQRRKGELGAIAEHVHAGEWKAVLSIANNIRGTGAMYGFENLGNAAEELVRAVENSDPEVALVVQAYVSAVNAAYV